MDEFFNAIENEEPMRGNPQMGYLKIGFTHAFRHLLKNTPYFQAIKETISIAGDTDTNCAIVGGMVGAL